MSLGILYPRLSRDDERLPGTEYLIARDQGVRDELRSEARELKHVVYKVQYRAS